MSGANFVHASKHILANKHIMLPQVNGILIYSIYYMCMNIII